jgi:hypothetical protein
MICFKLVVVFLSASRWWWCSRALSTSDAGAAHGSRQQQASLHESRTTRAMGDVRYDWWHKHRRVTTFFQLDEISHVLTISVASDSSPLCWAVCECPLRNVRRRTLNYLQRLSQRKIFLLRRKRRLCWDRSSRQNRWKMRSSLL